MAINIAAQQVLASPVTSFLQGRALQQSEVQQAQRSKLVESQLATAQQQRQQSAIEFASQQEIAKNKQNYLLATAAATSDNPAELIKQVKPEFIQTWDSQHGQGSFDSLKPEDLKKVANHLRAEYAARAGLQMPTQLRTIGDLSNPGAGILQEDLETGKLTEVVKPEKPTHPEDKTVGDSLVRVGPDGKARVLYTAPTKPAKVDIPSGYEPDPAKPGALRPIEGGPHDPNATASGMDSRSSVMFNRVAASANSAVKAIENIAELPVTTSAGLFGHAEPGHSLYDSAKAVLAQKVTSQEAQDYKAMIAGVSRNLSTIETAGLAPNGSITKSMDSITIGEGDTQMTKLRKLAEMRQIVEEGIKPQLSNPKLAPPQKELITTIISNVQKAIPFTHHDITQLQQSRDPKATIMDFARQSGLKTGDAQKALPRTNAKGWVLHQDANGNQAYVSPDGKQFETP